MKIRKIGGKCENKDFLIFFFCFYKFFNLHLGLKDKSWVFHGESKHRELRELESTTGIKQWQRRFYPKR